jgi:hypothetical protein
MACQMSSLNTRWRPRPTARGWQRRSWRASVPCSHMCALVMGFSSLPGSRQLLLPGVTVGIVRYIAHVAYFKFCGISVS